MATELQPLSKKAPGSEDEEDEDYIYKKVQWKDFVTKPKYIPWWILTIIIIILTGLFFIYHTKIVDALRPTSEKLRDLPAGFIIPVVILIIISFPPLFGHEIVAILCGIVWGLWIGFAIVATGTFLGEIGTWYAFKYLFRRKAIKLEKTNLNYGALARFTRDGGFPVVLIIRFSIIPSHFSTAVFSTCNVKFWHFAVATFLTLPKQIILVYVGVLIVQGSSDNTVQTIVLGITLLVTIIAGVYVYLKMRTTKKILLQEQEERLAARQALKDSMSNGTRRAEDGVWRNEIDRGRGNMPGGWQEMYPPEYNRRPMIVQEFI